MIGALLPIVAMTGLPAAAEGRAGESGMVIAPGGAAPPAAAVAPAGTMTT